jgi:hypothetical protein
VILATGQAFELACMSTYKGWSITVAFWNWDCNSSGASTDPDCMVAWDFALTWTGCRYVVEMYINDICRFNRSCMPIDRRR